jgi:hypothetical protein
MALKLMLAAGAWQGPLDHLSAQPEPFFSLKRFKYPTYSSGCANVKPDVHIHPQCASMALKLMLAVGAW